MVRLRSLMEKISLPQIITLPDVGVSRAPIILRSVLDVYKRQAFPYLPVLPCDFFLGAYPFACFIIEHAACGYLDVRFRKQLSFAEDKVDMIVCLAFVVVEG